MNHGCSLLPEWVFEVESILRLGRYPDQVFQFSICIHFPPNKSHIYTHNPFMFIVTLDNEFHTKTETQFRYCEPSGQVVCTGEIYCLCCNIHKVICVKIDCHDTVDKWSEDLALYVTTKHQLRTLDIFPTEIICEIISWASILVPDVIVNGLYTLTLVSKAMAPLVLPWHIKINMHCLPTLRFYYIGLNGDQFSLFPVWVQSNRFTSREEVMCHFASPNTDRKIRALNVGLICMLLEDHPKSLELNSDLNVTQALSLLDMAGQIVVQSVELDVLHLNWSLTAPECVVHKLAHLERLKIEWLSLSSATFTSYHSTQTESSDSQWGHTMGCSCFVLGSTHHHIWNQPPS